MTALRRRLLLTFLLAIAAVASASAQVEKVYVTRTGEKYHRDGCRSLARSKIEMPLADAAARYGACKVCRPPVPAATTAASVLPRSAEPPSRAVSAGRCQATTRKGTQCSRRAQAGRSYCWQH